jgi:MtN3 and saliva related transmembrane protein
MPEGAGKRKGGRTAASALPSSHTIVIIVAYPAVMQLSVVDMIGLTGAALTTLCWLPQALKILRERDTRALSLPATAAFTAGIALWLIYGLALVDWPLIGANLVTLVLMMVILGLKLRHG